MSERTLPAPRVVRQTPSWCASCGGAGFTIYRDDWGREREQRCGCGDGLFWDEEEIAAPPAPRPALDAEALGRVAFLRSQELQGRAPDIAEGLWSLNARDLRGHWTRIAVAVAAAIAPPDAREIAGELRALAAEIPHATNLINAAWSPPVQDRLRPLCDQLRALAARLDATPVESS